MFVLRLLGPLSLLVQGRPLGLPTAKAAALLALLALDGAAPRERIAAWLWPQQDAAGSRRNLRRELARLREIGAGDALVATGERLALAASVEVDSARFAQLLDAGQTEAALALWQGQPADGLALPEAPAFDDWLAARRAQWARRRAAALEARAAALEAAGQPDAALRAIQTLLDDDPLQEAHQRSAMRLHAAAGRRAAALAGYERFAALLASELGLAPMADTVALMQTLRQPADTPAPRTLPSPAPRPPRPAVAAFSWPSTLPFVGRDAELAQLDAAWQQGLAIVIEGPAGIGKSRLAAESAAARGAYALASCRQGDAGEPYAAFSRALRSLAGVGLEQTDWPRWIREELAHLLPELGVAPQRIDSEAARQRFFEACTQAWQMLAAGSFDAVIVDDWHLADAASQALFDHIVRRRVVASGADGGAEGPRAIWVTRPPRLPDEGRIVDALVRDGAALHLRLPPLSDAEIAQLADRLAAGRAPAQLGPQLARASAGNPFVAGETLRHWLDLAVLRTDGASGWLLEDGAQDIGPHTGGAQATVLARVAALPQEALRLLEAAALAREPFTPALLAGACALSEVQALSAIEAAMAAQLLREREGGFAFTHDLVQAALESQLSADRRRLVHRRLALGAEALHGHGALPASLVAHHWEAGGEPARAVALRLAAAEAALAVFEDALAESHWALALADGATLAQRITITSRRAAIQRNGDDVAALRVSIDELLRLADEAAQHPDTAAAGLQARIDAADGLSLMTGCYADALVHIDAVLAALGPPRAGDDAVLIERRAAAQVVRSQALNCLGRTDEGIVAAETALASGALPARLQGRLLHSLAFAHFQRSDPVAGLKCSQRSLALWQSIGLRRSIARAHGNLGLMACMLGRNVEGRREMTAALQMAQEMRMHELTREVLLNLAYIDLAEGVPDAALATLADAHAAAPGFTQQDYPILILGMQVHAHAQAGRLGQALDCAENAHRLALALGDASALADCVSMALDLAADIGDFAFADTLVASLPGGADSAPKFLRIKLAFNLAHLALARGRPDDAARELQAIEPVAALAQPYDRGYATLRHAELCLARGDAGGALRWVEQGADDAAVHVEAAALMQAAKVRALRLLHGDSAPDMHQARGEAMALFDGDKGMPALAGLALKRACGVDASADTRRLADSLADRPAQRERFLSHWETQRLQR